MFTAIFTLAAIGVVATLAKPRSKRFLERTANPTGRVDSDRGILHDVKILGEHSANGRHYLPRAMREAVSLYEGRKCYIGHPTRDRLRDDRKFEDWAGVFRNVRYVEGDGLRGDLHLLKSSRYFESIIEAARSFPTSLGLSHVADGDSHVSGGKEIVESITEVASVDLVMDPATTRGLFESLAVKAIDDADAPSEGDRLPGPQRREINQLAALALRYRDLAVKVFERAFRSGDPAAVAELRDPLNEITTRLDSWIRSDTTGLMHDDAITGELKSIVAAINADYGDPQTEGALQRVSDALDSLVDLVNRLAGGEDDGRAVAESVRSTRRWNDRLRESRAKKAGRQQRAAVSFESRWDEALRRGRQR